VTKMDINDKPVLDHYRQYLGRLFINAPVFEVDARRKEDVSALVNALYYSSLASSAARAEAKRPGSKSSEPILSGKGMAAS